MSAALARRARLREWLAGEACLDAIWLSLGSVAVAEMAARARPGVVVLDLQHGLWDRASLEAAIGVADAHAPVMARLSDPTPHSISQALDAGAEGVLAPLIETAAEAAALVSAARFPPEGARSGGGIRPLQDFAAYVEYARRAVVVGAMIETSAGLANGDSIAATPGLDFLFIGSGDLSLSLGEFPNAGRRVERACAAILSASLAARRPCGVFTGSLEAARAMRAKGYRMVVSATDADVMRHAFTAAAHGFAQAEGSPDDERARPRRAKRAP
jgi:2-keto-3-deoxy-L-rhamnonate aldolase RhmA